MTKELKDQFFAETQISAKENMPTFFAWYQTRLLSEAIAEMKIQRESISELRNGIVNIASHIDWACSGSDESGIFTFKDNTDNES